MGVDHTMHGDGLTVQGHAGIAPAIGFAGSAVLSVPEIAWRVVAAVLHGHVAINTLYDVVASAGGLDAGIVEHGTLPDQCDPYRPTATVCRSIWGLRGLRVI